MFTSGGHDLVGFTCGLNRISIIGKPMMSLWFIGTFCTNFISYQLETWQMLADIHHSMEVSGEDGPGESCCLAQNVVDYAKCYVGHSEAHLRQVPPIGVHQGASGDLYGCQMTQTTTTTTDDNFEQRRQQQQQTASRSIRQDTNCRQPKCSICYATKHHNACFNANMNPTTTATTHHHHHLYNPQQLLSNELSPENGCYRGQHRSYQPQLHNRECHERVYANFRPNSSMDRRAEYLARRQLASVDLPVWHDWSSLAQHQQQQHQQQQECHRPRNASYSSTRMRNNIASLQPELGPRPSTGTFLAHKQSAALASSCSPSSSGSLPASLHHSNWPSYSEDLGGPASLPLPENNRPSYKSQQATPGYRAPPFGPSTAAHNKQLMQQQAAAHYRWYHETFDLGAHHERLDRASEFAGRVGGNNNRHSLLVSSDSDLYSNHHHHQTHRRPQNIALAPQNSVPTTQTTTTTSKQVIKNVGRNKQTSDNLRSVNQSLARNDSVSTSSTPKPQQTNDNGLNGRKGTSFNKLSLAGAKRRLGFRQKGLVSLSVQRCEEVIPPVASRQYLSQMTSSSFADSTSGGASNWISQQTNPESNDPRTNFVDGLGAGQIASRQALVSPYLGDIQLTISDRRGMLEVEVVRARGLQIKPGAKTLPSPYVKLYLMKNKKCLAKTKTLPVRQTLNPLYQQQFIFREDYTECILQVIVWADYGKNDRKSLSGIVQIKLDDLDISNLIIDWYRLFNAPSMANTLLSSKALRQLILSKTIDNDSTRS